VLLSTRKTTQTFSIATGLSGNPESAGDDGKREAYSLIPYSLILIPKVVIGTTVAPDVVPNAGVAPGAPGITERPNVPTSAYEGPAPPEAPRPDLRTVQQRPKEKAKESPPEAPPLEYVRPVRRTVQRRPRKRNTKNPLPPPPEPGPQSRVSSWAKRERECSRFTHVFTFADPSQLTPDIYPPSRHWNLHPL